MKEEFNLEETQKFISVDGVNPNTNVKIVDSESGSRHVAFNGLSKDEIIKYGSDPTWVRIRWILFVVFWLLWFGMLAFAITIVVVTPKCPYRPKQQWWDREVVYQVDVATFKDSNDDAIGDLRGLAQKIDYFESLGTKVVALKDNLLDDADASKVNVKFGSDEDFLALKKTLDDKDMHLIIDIPATSLGSNDKEILSKWLNNYADGIRITQLDKWAITGQNRTSKLNEWIILGNKIFEKTFRPKTVIFYPFSRESKDSPNPSLVISENLLNIQDSDLKSYSNFIAKTNFTDATSYILGYFSSKRIADSLNTTKYASVYHGLALLLKGTPILLYGDELEYTKQDKYMNWDKMLPGCGFTNSSVPLPQLRNCQKTVKRAFAYGNSDASLLRLYERLIKLRRDEPSFKWGNFHTNDDKINVISYVREADRFDGFLVVANLDSMPHLVDLQSRHNLPKEEATVEYYYAGDGVRSSDFSTLKAKVRINNVYMKSGDFLVLRFSREPTAADAADAGQSAAHHG